MARAKTGDTVRIHYTGTLDDGTVVGSSTAGKPIEIILGQGQVIPGVERAIEGMAPGESKSTQVPPEEAYGQRRDDLVVVVPREQLPPDLDPEVGQKLSVKEKDGHEVSVRVTDTSETTITVDANHALAGHQVTFDLELVDVL
jgi:peptidylprolyl isomerase